MNKVLLTTIPLLLVVFIGGFLTAKHYYQTNQDKTTETDVSHTKTRTIRITDPKGNVREITDTDTTSKSTSTTVTVIPPKTNISVLVANDFSQSVAKPIYGLSVTREVLGPVTVGVFGFTNSTIGVSIGYNF